MDNSNYFGSDDVSHEGRMLANKPYLFLVPSSQVPALSIFKVKAGAISCERLFTLSTKVYSDKKDRQEEKKLDLLTF